jgi:hypothetical protein
MASDLSTYLGNAICLWLAGTNMPAAPANCYVALFNGDPKASGVEVTTDIRPAGRVAVDWDSISAGVDNVIVNDADVDFGNSDQDNVDVTHAALMDASSSGNVLCSKAVVGGPLVIEVGSPVKFLPGDLTFTIGS